MYVLMKEGVFQFGGSRVGLMKGGDMDVGDNPGSSINGEVPVVEVIGGNVLGRLWRRHSPQAAGGYTP